MGRFDHYVPALSLWLPRDRHIFPPVVVANGLEPFTKPLHSSTIIRIIIMSRTARCLGTSLRRVVSVHSASSVPSTRALLPGKFTRLSFYIRFS